MAKAKRQSTLLSFFGGGRSGDGGGGGRGGGADGGGARGRRTGAAGFVGKVGKRPRAGGGGDDAGRGRGGGGRAGRSSSRSSSASSSPSPRRPSPSPPSPAPILTGSANGDLGGDGAPPRTVVSSEDDDVASAAAIPPSPEAVDPAVDRSEADGSAGAEDEGGGDASSSSSSSEDGDDECDDSDDGDGSSDGSDDDASSSDGRDGGKSAYELLRDKNVARNEARLRALGLLASGASASAAARTDGSAEGRTIAKRKRANAVVAPAVPTRRSRRLRGAVTTGTGTVLEVHRDGDDVAASSAGDGSCNGNCDEAAGEAEAEEEFADSALFEYQMARAASKDDIMTPRKGDDVGGDERESDQFGAATLVPRGPRLVPPAGLNAIYTLEFGNEIGSADGGGGPSWLVGAGKAGLVALWDCSRNRDASKDDDEGDAEGGPSAEPVLSWKGHGGRWVADARFLPPPSGSFGGGSSANGPGRLLTAANDGTACLWDLASSSVRTGAPRLLGQSSKALHASGIFSMDVSLPGGGGGNGSVGTAHIATGSKDKTVAVATVDRLERAPIWRSDFHKAKVGCVSFARSSPGENDISCPLIASASDDGAVAVHDCRAPRPATTLEGAHVKPHSATWKPGSDRHLLTAGLDDVVKLWDLRCVASPVASYRGHVRAKGRLKRIHRSTFLGDDGSLFLTGGEGSSAVSVYRVDGARGGANGDGGGEDDGLQAPFSRGKLPPGAGDAGSLAVRGRDLVATSVEGGEVLLLSMGA